MRPCERGATPMGVPYAVSSTGCLGWPVCCCSGKFSLTPTTAHQRCRRGPSRDWGCDGGWVFPAKAGVTGLFPSNRIRLYRLHACPPMPAPPEGPVRPALFEAVVIQVMAPVGYPYAAEAQRVIGERIGMPGQRSSDRRGELQGPIERVEQPLGG